MVYLPLFTYIYHKNQPNVGKFTWMVWEQYGNYFQAVGGSLILDILATFFKANFCLKPRGLGPLPNVQFQCDQAILSSCEIREDTPDLENERMTMEQLP